VARGSGAIQAGFKIHLVFKPLHLEKPVLYHSQISYINVAFVIEEAVSNIVF
jgi:hypothetical protein